MKKTTLPTEKPSSTTKTEQGIESTVTPVKPKGTGVTQKAAKKSSAKPTKSVPTAEPTIAAVAAVEKVIKSPVKKTLAKAPQADVKVDVEPQAKVEIPAAKPKPVSATNQPTKPSKSVASNPIVEATDLLIAERVGLTAGNLWHYLSQNGVTPVSKLLKALSEEERIIQRSIGWLAHEGKIEFINHDRVESIRLTD